MGRNRHLVFLTLTLLTCKDTESFSSAAAELFGAAGCDDDGGRHGIAKA